MIFSKSAIFIGLVSACFYFSFAILLLNTRLLAIMFSYPSPISEKVLLVCNLLQSAPSVLSPTQFFLLMSTAILVGANMSIGYQMLLRMKKVSNAALSTTSSIVGMFSVGCASCGYPMLSVFGLSGGMALLPFKGSELYIIAIALLVYSCYHNLKKLHSPLVCKK